MDGLLGIFGNFGVFGEGLFHDPADVGDGEEAGVVAGTRIRGQIYLSAWLLSSFIICIIN